MTDEIAEQVRVLDGINRCRLEKDPELMAEWNAARLVPGGTGRSPREPERPAVGSDPPERGIAPAA